MKRLLPLLLFLSILLHAAGPVRIAFDAKVVDWDSRCQTNFLNTGSFVNSKFYNSTLSKLASSVWMGGFRAAGLYPGNILRANLFCGVSYGGTYGAGDDGSSFINIGSPQVPLINDQGGSLDISGQFQNNWFYQETGSNGGLGERPGLTTGVYLNTGIVPTNISAWLNDIHVSYYMTSGGIHAAVTIGAYENSSQMYIFLTSTYTAAGQLTIIGNNIGNPANADTTGLGYYVGTRTSSATNGAQQYKNGVSTGTSTATGGTLVITVPIHVFECSGAPSILPCTNKMAGYTLGRGVTAAQQLAAYNAMQQAQTLLTRQK